MLYAIHAGLGVLLDEGAANVQARHQTCGDALQAGLEARGFELFAQAGSRLPQLTSVRVPADKLPDGATEADVRATLLTEYGIEIGGGLGELAGKGWRIGLMGHTARLRNVTLLLAALDDILA
jgi:alanine-glyoxylate transaminase/serine-glyoxylate transaminase/serine-pyruvate transaminase